MFGQRYDSNFRDFCLHVNITCRKPVKKRFRVWAEEADKKNSKYADRRTHQDICVDGKVSIFLSFPVTPKTLFIGVLNADDPRDKDFDVVLIEAPLKMYAIEMDEKTKRFFSMAIKFSQISGYEQATDAGRPFVNENKEFEIKFYNVIKDRLTGAAMNTPARIGHQTGIIDFAKCKTDRHTVPAKVAILGHEYCHVNRNPVIGLKIENEKGADINMLYYYLGMGFSQIDAINVFANVFFKARTKSNLERMNLIYDYCKRYKNQEFAQLID